MLGQKFLQQFCWFFGIFQETKFISEIIWPLKNINGDLTEVIEQFADNQTNNDNVLMIAQFEEKIDKIIDDAANSLGGLNVS